MFPKIWGHQWLRNSIIQNLDPKRAPFGYDGCMVTGEVQKAKYIYTDASCEGDLAQRLGEPLKGLQVLERVVSQIAATLRDDQNQSVNKVSAEHSRLEG